jgi:hypothetical protein
MEVGNMSFEEEDDVSTLQQALVPLSDLSDYDVASGYPDIRGWDVKAGTDKIGEIKDLLVDTTALEARYIVIGLKHGLFEKERKAIVPIGRARLDENAKDVYLDDVDINRLDALREYDPDYFRGNERNFFSGDYSQPEYSRQRFWGDRGSAGGMFLVRRTTYVGTPLEGEVRPELADVDTKEPEEV